MAGRFDVDSAAMPYGSVGGAGIRALQTEILRRAQDEEAQRAEAERQQQLALQNARLDRQDKRQAGLDEVNKQKILSDIASNEDLRRSTAEAHDEATKQKRIADFQAMNPPGPISADAAGTGRALGLGGLMLAKPAMTGVSGVTGLPGTTVPVGDAPASAAMTAPAGPATTEDTTLLPTKKQADAERSHQALSDLYNGKLHLNRSDALAMEAWWKDVGGGTPLPAGVVVPKAAPGEKLSDRELLAMDGLAKKEADRSPEEVAAIAGEKGMADLKAGPADRRAAQTIVVQRERDASNQMNKAQEVEYKGLETKLKDLKTADATKLLETLSVEGGVNDVIAIPEFLSMMAGGQGKGLRMTQTELNMIQKARPGYQNGYIALSNLLGTDYQALTAEQRSMMSDLAKRIAQRELAKSALYAQGRADIADATSAKEAHDIVTEIDRKEAGLYGARLGITTPGVTTPTTPKSGATHVYDPTSDSLKVK